MLALRLSIDMQNRLGNLAKRTGRTKASLAREAILRHINDLEDYYVAAERLKRLGKAVSLEELEQELLIERSA